MLLIISIPFAFVLVFFCLMLTAYRFVYRNDFKLLPIDETREYKNLTYLKLYF